MKPPVSALLFTYNSVFKKSVVTLVLQNEHFLKKSDIIYSNQYYKRKKEDVMTHFERLKPIRVERGLTEGDIAKVLGTTPERVRRIESGERKMQLHEYITLAKFYNLSLDYIAGRIDTPLTLFEEE